MAISPDEYWLNLDLLPGRRIRRQRTSKRDYVFTDSADEILGTAQRRHRSWQELGSTMITPNGTFRTLDQGLWTDFGWRHWFALQRDSEYSQSQTLMMSGDRSRRFKFNRIGPSDERPFGTINLWSLPDGTPLDAYCVGAWQPFHVLLLKSHEKTVLSLRYLAPKNQTFRHMIQLREDDNFALGEAVLDDEIPDGDEILPLLMFAFEVLQAINTVEREAEVIGMSRRRK